MVTNLGKWDRWFAGVEDPEPFGLSITYDLAYEWLKDCATVEDWGCGKGWFSQYFEEEGRYVGVDGSQTPYADVVADLTEYRSEVDGILLRHVLEHNYEWAKILDGAVTSAQERLCIILFTPFAANTHTIAWADDPGVPDISFNTTDLTTPLFRAGFDFTVETLETSTQYGEETIIRCSR